MERRNFLRSVIGTTVASSIPLSPFAQEPPAPQRRPQLTRARRATTMYGLPAAPDLSSLTADVAFLGVPYDLGHASKPGTRLGPEAIREASDIAGPPIGADGGFHDRETGSNILAGVRCVDAGDVIVPQASIEGALDNVTAAVSGILARKAMPLVIGGDHSITFAVLRGFKDAGRKIHVIHFDSHQDFGPAADASGRKIYGHGNHLRHAIDLPWISGITMLGLRGLARGTGGTANEARNHNIAMISASEIVRLGAKETVARIPAAENYYVTFDIDVMDPAIAPATGTPVPGGLSYYLACDVLAEIAARGRMAGFDMMEVSPPYDLGNETSLLSAYLILRFLGAIFAHQKTTAV
jgi:agmatinase